MTRYRLTLEYDGEHFSGWQVQPERRTLQRALEKAAAAIFQRDIRVFAAGRTDAGVHALGQVACLDIDKDMPPEKLLLALNAHTPEDLSVVHVDRVPETFDPRRHSAGKLYTYTILNRPAKPTLDLGRVWHVPKHLDVETMRRAAGHLVGEHDFSSFRASDCQAAHPVRYLYSLKVQRDGERIAIRVFATAFLKHMVRNLVGVLVDVGRGRLAPEDVPAILQARDRSKASQTAPASGLCLESVFFDDRPPPEDLARCVPVSKRNPRGGFEDSDR